MSFVEIAEAELALDGPRPHPLWRSRLEAGSSGAVFDNFERGMRHALNADTFYISAYLNAGQVDPEDCLGMYFGCAMNCYAADPAPGSRFGVDLSFSVNLGSVTFRDLVVNNAPGRIAKDFLRTFHEEQAVLIPASPLSSRRRGGPVADFSSGALAEQPRRAAARLPPHPRHGRLGQGGDCHVRPGLRRRTEDLHDALRVRSPRGGRVKKTRAPKSAGLGRGS